MKYRINASLRTVLIISDLVLILVALYSASSIGPRLSRGQSLLPVNLLTTDWGLYLVVGAIWLGVALALGTYGAVQTRLAYQEIRHLLKAVVVSGTLLAGLLFMTTFGASRLRFVYFFIIVVPLLIVFRLALRVTYRLVFHRAWGTAMIAPARVVVVGEGTILYETLCTLSNCDPREVALLGYIDYKEDLANVINASSGSEKSLFTTTSWLNDSHLAAASSKSAEELVAVERNSYGHYDNMGGSGYNGHNVGARHGASPMLTVVHPVHTSASARAATRWGLTAEAVAPPQEEKSPEASTEKVISDTLGTEVERLVMASHADNVVVAISRRYHRLLSKVIADLQRLPVHIVLMPDVADLTILNVGITELGDAPALKLRAPILTDMQLALKRLLDLALVVPLMPFLLPLMGIVALAIRLDSSGPIVFKQKRVGQYGKHFTIFKFRTMVQDAEARLREVTTFNEDGKPLFKNDGGDPRITRVGNILRRLSLDELPQLFNVLLGHMSLVGPRPELPTYVGFYETWQHFRLWVPPGITGWWQVKGREKQPMYLYWDDDLYYIRNYSLLLDLQILWLTFSHAMLGSTGR